MCIIAPASRMKGVACLIGVDPTTAQHIASVLERNEHRIVRELRHADALPDEHVDVIFAGGDPHQYLGLLATIHNIHKETAVIVVGERPSTMEWLDAIEAGATDYLALPLSERTILWALGSIGVASTMRAAKKPTSPEEVLRELNAEVESALERFNEASRQYRTIAGDVVRGGMPSDAASDVHAAARAQRDAAEEVNRALMRRDEFIVNGKIPEKIGNGRKTQAAGR